MWFGAPCFRPRTCIQRVTTGDHYVDTTGDYGRPRATDLGPRQSPTRLWATTGDRGRPIATELGPEHQLVCVCDTTGDHERPRETTGDHGRPPTGDHRPRIWGPNKHPPAYGRPRATTGYRGGPRAADLGPGQAHIRLRATTGDHGRPRVIDLGPGQAHSNTGDHARLRETTLH